MGGDRWTRKNKVCSAETLLGTLTKELCRGCGKSGHTFLSIQRCVLVRSPEGTSPLGPSLAGRVWVGRGSGFVQQPGSQGAKPLSPTGVARAKPLSPTGVTRGRAPITHWGRKGQSPYHPTGVARGRAPTPITPIPGSQGQRLCHPP